MTEVQVHLHFTMCGSAPLRLLDLLFCPDRVLSVEYDYLTPLDVARGSPKREADAFAETLRSGGVPAALSVAENVTEHYYETLEAIRVYDGGRFGRETVVLEPASGPTRVVRVHGAVDLGAFTDAVRDVVSPYSASIERREGMALEFGGRLDRFSRR